MNKNESVKCEICGKLLKVINNFHLGYHNVFVKEYKS